MFLVNFVIVVGQMSCLRNTRIFLLCTYNILLRKSSPYVCLNRMDMSTQIKVKKYIIYIRIYLIIK